MNVFEKVDNYLVENKDKWIRWGGELATMPEYGFCEVKTSAYIREKLEELGITDIKETAVTGLIARLPGRAHKGTAAYIGELDGIYSPENETADPETGVSHACGHNIQTTALLALAEAFVKTGAMEELDGDLLLMAVPAEENTPTDILERLKAEGKISEDCGKREMIKHHDFDGIDAVIGSHSLEDYPGVKNLVMVNSSCHGQEIYRFEFKGKAAHSTVCPEKGINALNAVVNAINGIQAVREYFPPEESIRVSYNIVEGGHNIGSIVDYAVLDVVAAARSMEGLGWVIKQIIKACVNGASMTGCKLEYRMTSRYKPYVVDDSLLEVIKENATKITGCETNTRPHNYFSNDLGDVSQMIPTAQIVYGGCEGDLHSPEFRITDEEDSFVNPARVTASTLIDLLSKDCEKLVKIREGFRK